jgi:hypothetical protein
MLPMQELRVVFDLYDGGLKPRFVNGQELPNWKDGPLMIDYFRQKQGEGCHMESTANPQTYIFHCPSDRQ